MSVVSLKEAAGKAYDLMEAQWATNSLKAHLTAFCTSALLIFPDSDDNARPVANWLTIMSAQAAVMASVNVPITTLSIAAEYMYNMMWLAQVLETAGSVTGVQAIALLAAFNAQFP